MKLTTFIANIVNSQHYVKIEMNLIEICTLENLFVRGSTMQKTSELIIENTKKYLKKNDQSQTWLASEMGITPSLLSQIFKRSRNLQTKHIVKIAEVTGMSIDELTKGKEDITKKELNYSLRGHISTDAGKTHFAAVKADIQHYVMLGAD